jgi:hypothetical protein
VKTRRPLLTTPPRLQRRDAARLQREVLATQPWVGFGGLALSAVVFFALALGLGNTATSLLVLGPMTVFAVSGVAMIGFWWNDWPERVPASREQSDRLLAQARVHVASAMPTLTWPGVAPSTRMAAEAKHASVAVAHAIS